MTRTESGEILDRTTAEEAHDTALLDVIPERGRRSNTGRRRSGPAHAASLLESSCSSPWWR